MGKRKEDTPKLPCGHLVSGTSVQCQYQGPYRYENRGRPSKARAAEGDAEFFGRIVSDHPYLACIPAENFRGALVEGRRDTYTFDDLINEQRGCSKFKPR
jgi:hypothetical protein